MKYTKEQKQKYFKKLRERWAESKKLAEKDETAKALYKEAFSTTTTGNISYWSFYFTLQDMRANGFDGIPYVDCKTYQGWLKSGFRVKRGEKSRISGIVWLAPMVRDEETGELVEDESGIRFPKLYHLFHRSQVEEI